MAGIVLVTKPPFLFPDKVTNSNGTNFSSESFVQHYLSKNYLQYNFKRNSHRQYKNLIELVDKTSKEWSKRRLK